MTGNDDDELTLDWYRAKAMLLHMAYDPRDHTFNAFSKTDGRFRQIVDADTMTAPDGIGTFSTISSRSEKIFAGELGPKCLHGVPNHERDEMWDEEVERVHSLIGVRVGR